MLVAQEVEEEVEVVELEEQVERWRRPLELPPEASVSALEASSLRRCCCCVATAALWLLLPPLQWLRTRRKKLLCLPPK